MDDKYPRNFVNADFGIDPSINQGVTDVAWFAKRVGLIEFMDVHAGAVPVEIGETYELKSYTLVPVPAAAWLFGSGLVGLIGITKRKKA